MINHDLRIIFIHIPKTGGTTLRAALDPKNKLDQRPERSVLPHIIPEMIDQGLWNRYLTFTFTRHPLDRLLSCYLFDIKRIAEKSKGSLGRRKLVAESKDFEDYIVNYLPKIIDKQDDNGFMVWPMFRFFEHRQYDFVGKFETFASDFAFICQRIGVVRQMQHLQATEHEHWSLYYTQRAYNTAVKLYSLDFELFHYTLTDLSLQVEIATRNRSS